MFARWSRADGLTVGSVLLAALLGVALWPRLPAEVAIHFSASGTPDNYVPKALGVALVPALMIATWLFLKAAVRFDPPDDPRVAQVTLVATMGLLLALHAIVLAWNLGYRTPMEYVLAGSLLWAVLLCGYAFRREGVSLG